MFGISLVHISPIPFALVKLPTLGKKPLARLSLPKFTPTTLPSIGVFAVLGGFYWIRKRREEVRKAQEDDHQ